jgi:hypothetical protein
MISGTYPGPRREGVTVLAHHLLGIDDRVVERPRLAVAERGGDLQPITTDVVLLEVVLGLKLVLHSGHDVAAEFAPGRRGRVGRLDFREVLKVGQMVMRVGNDLVKLRLRENGADALGGNRSGGPTGHGRC